MYASVNARPATRARLSVPDHGVWFCELDLPEDVELSGRVRVELGGLELVGTVDDGATGRHALETRTRVLGGAGGWRQSAPAKHHHNDAGVKISTILETVASKVGETVEGAPTTRVGADYVRRAGPASATIEKLFPGRWRVDYDGVTRVGNRPASRLGPDQGEAVAILDFDPRERVYRLGIEDLRAVSVGAELGGRPIRGLEVVVGDGLEVRAFV